MNRVVITGYGVVSSSGNDADTFWSNVANGISGIKRIKDEAFLNLKTQIAGYIENFNAEKYLSKKEISRNDIFTVYAYAAAKDAITMSGITDENTDKNRMGTYIGSGIGGISTTLGNHINFLAKGWKAVSPFMVPDMISNMAAGFVAIKEKLKGPSFSPVSACASANQAIGEAFLSIKYGRADAMIAGGAEAPINPPSFAGFDQMRAMSDNNDSPREACKPFDKKRNGFVMSEGAGILVLENLEKAQKRGAKILGEITGYGATTDAKHITSPDFEGAAAAMEIALETAGISPSEVDYINAHATGTPAGDLSENNAIKNVFKEHAKKLKISATKSITGHLFGASGGAEAIITLKAIENNLVPPTINLTEPDDGFDLDYVPGKAVKFPVKTAVSNAFGFGGHNTSLVFRKFEG